VWLKDRGSDSKIEDDCMFGMIEQAGVGIENGVLRHINEHH